MATITNDKPNATSLAYERQMPALTIVRDVYGGTMVLRGKRIKYLPQFPKEENKSYEARLKGAVLFNCLKTTVTGLSGMVFRKDVKLADTVPDAIRKDAENIDLTGRPLSTFAKDVFEAQLRDGHTYVFVDYQAVDPNEIARLADERAADLRPYWVHIDKADVLRLRTINVHGRPLLVEMAYRQCTTEPDGLYGEKSVERVRIYRLQAATDGNGLQVFYEVHKRIEVSGDASSNEWMLETPPTPMSIDRIPLRAFYSNRTALFESEPLFLDLAYENILHYQTRSDRTNSLHIAGVPIPVLIGLDEEQGKIAVGSDTGLILPVGGNAKYLEPVGASLEEMREELTDIEARMAALGLSALQRETRAAETAEAKRIDKSASDSQLAKAAREHKAGLEECVSYHAKWRKLDVKANDTVTVNMDFNTEMMDAAMVKELRSAVASGQLSLETMWDRLVQGGVLDDEFDPEEEKRRIAEDITSMPLITPMAAEPIVDKQKLPQDAGITGVAA